MKPRAQRQRNPGPVLLLRQVPPELQGLVAHTGLSQRSPVKPGGQLQYLWQFLFRLLN